MREGMKYFVIPLLLFISGMITGWWMMARNFHMRLDSAGIKLVDHHVAASNWVEAVSTKAGGAR